ncbi:MAG: HEAT repeat domain-containing protein [Pirellulaceae bacterium]
MDVVRINQAGLRRHVRLGRWSLFSLILALLIGMVIAETVGAQEANWIWSRQHQQGEIPIGPTHFRKTFSLQRPVVGELVIAADDEFQVYFNNQLVGYGSGYDELTRIELTPHMIDGENLIAVRATNTQGTSAAVSVIMRFRLDGETAWRWLATDETWKSAVTVNPSWKHRNFNDVRWPNVGMLGSFGSTSPWDDVRMAGTNADANPSEREVKPEQKDPGREFSVPENFVVDQILDETVGSLIALEFNEFGQLIISREGGKLLLADMSGSEEGEITVRKYCDVMENVQGILPLNGDVFVTGQGPEGLGLYRLADKDRDGMLEPVHKLTGFRGELGEHGPHGLTLGPDGMIYVIIGNASGLTEQIHPSSPVTIVHEGEVLPRLEDPGGHAAGIMAPGGTIVRIAPDGSRREVVASGIRNSYDLAFNSAGDLFCHDSDMESDVGTPWYRPTQVLHITAGGEYGWRSGTAKFPAYYIDGLPAIVETGRGSPTGSVVYDHVMMPMRYHGSLFLGDWSEGRILSVRLTEESDSYKAKVEEFLSAQPLTVTDLAVGPDGAIYFSTGGRGTEGGVYRVSWNGQVPDEYRLLDDELSQLVGRPQPQSAWTRQDLAKIKTEMGQEWGRKLNGVVSEQRNDINHRLRSLEILGLYGPMPSDELLIRLAGDPDPQMQSRATRLIGWRSGAHLVEPVIENLSDTDAKVRRAACEALRHMRQQPDWHLFARSLMSESRTEAFAARRLLESIAPSQWRDEILKTDNSRVFLQGATALMIIEPNLQNAYQVLARSSELMQGYMSDRDFVDLLRVTQLALVQGEIDPTKIPLFLDRVMAEFPAGNGLINRELSRTIGYLGDERIGERIEEYLSDSSDSQMDKLQVALNLRDVAGKFTGEQRMAVIEFLEQMQTRPEASEGNYVLYVAKILESYSGEIEESQISQILKNGAKLPSAALAAFYQLPEELTEEQVEWISEMDRQLKGRTDTTAIQARLGCIAVLGRSGDDSSMYYLREVWRHEKERRNDVALALAQQPDGPNWPYLISSLGELSDDSAREVIKQLVTVNKSPREPRFFRQTILTGYRLRESGAKSASNLMEHWSGDQVESDSSEWKALMKSWAEWFNEKYPDEEPITFEDQQTIGKYSVDEVLSFIEENNEPVRMHSGMLAFTKAQCVKCHRFNGQGEPMGPDLSTIARRFSEREILREILHPSAIISDQYQAKKIITVDGEQYIGLLTESGTGGYVLLQTDGEKINFDPDDIDEIAVAEVSAMPEGLLDDLSLDEVRDLMSWLRSGTPEMAEASGRNTENQSR